MALTVRAIVEELRAERRHRHPAVAAAVTKGSLMGARGNSGVILSQIVRGMCDVWGHADALDTAGLQAGGRRGPARGLSRRQEASRGHHAHRHPRDGRRLRRRCPTARRSRTYSRRWRRPAGSRSRTRPPSCRPCRRPASSMPAATGCWCSSAASRTASRTSCAAASWSRARAWRRGRRGGQGARCRRSDCVRSVDEPSELSVFRYCTSFLITGREHRPRGLRGVHPPAGRQRSWWSATSARVKVHVHVNDPGVVLTRSAQVRRHRRHRDQRHARADARA